MIPISPDETNGRKNLFERLFFQVPSVRDMSEWMYTEHINEYARYPAARS